MSLFDARNAVVRAEIDFDVCTVWDFARALGEFEGVVDAALQLYLEGGGCVCCAAVCGLEGVESYAWLGPGLGLRWWHVVVDGSAWFVWCCA